MATTTQGDFLNACDKVVAAATANAGQPGVDDLRAQLQKDSSGIREAQARRNLHKAQAQQASRDLDEAMDSAREIYSRLRHLLIGLFGVDAEKLVEFGWKPLRPPQIPLEQKAKRLEAKKKPPENGQSPTQAASPQTESSN